MNDRARLTPVDVIFIAVGFAVLAFLSEPLYTVMNDQASTLGKPEAFLFQLIVPGIVLTMLYVTYATAIGGANA